MADRTGVRGPRLRSLFSALAIALLLASCGGSDGGNGAGGENSADDAPVNEAQAIFIEVGCAECHGEQGEIAEGNMRAIQGTMMIEGQFTTRVRNGRGQAKPGFTAEQISDEEIKMIYEWLAGQ